MKYSPRFKLKVVEFAQESNNCAAGHEFYINEKLVHHWRKQGEKLNACQRTNAATVGKSSGGPMQFTKYRKISLVNRSACECLNHGDIKKC